jgi:FAD/FMN-containing dehydrogenase
MRPRPGARFEGLARGPPPYPMDQVGVGMRRYTRREVVTAVSGATFANVLSGASSAQPFAGAGRKDAAVVGALATALQAKTQGRVIAAGGPAYERVRRDLVWNQVVPARYPKLICQVEGEHDVIEAVDFARAHGLKIAVRGGGHNWVGFSLRDDSLLIDMAGLNKIVSIDVPSRSAIVQPGVRGAELSAALAKSGLAFPTGHCPTVRVSGFLLNGGLGWNLGAWGPSCFSVEAADVVTADGKMVTASETEHADLLWALRGAGPGFFGAITQYRLKTYPAPRNILASDYFYPLDQLDQVGAWAASIAGKVPRQVELTLFVLPAPPSLAASAKAANGYVAFLNGTAFADTLEQAKAALAPLEGSPASLPLLSKTVDQKRTMPELLKLSGQLWPERHRYFADNLWTDAPVEQPLAAMRDRFLHAPSSKSLGVCIFTTGGEAPAKIDAAFSMMGRNYLLYYSVWERADDDRPNSVWHGDLREALDHFAVGHYVGETDIVTNPGRAEKSFTPESWKRLQGLRQTYDPAGLFLGEFGPA